MTLEIWLYFIYLVYTDGLVQDCSNSIANALELLQSYRKPSIQCGASFTWSVLSKILHI